MLRSKLPYPHPGCHRNVHKVSNMIRDDAGGPAGVPGRAGTIPRRSGASWNAPAVPRRENGSRLTQVSATVAEMLLPLAVLVIWTVLPHRPLFIMLAETATM